jgi:hypothetical protein
VRRQQCSLFIWDETSDGQFFSLFDKMHKSWLVDIPNPLNTKQRICVPEQGKSSATSGKGFFIITPLLQVRCASISWSSTVGAAISISTGHRAPFLFAVLAAVLKKTYLLNMPAHPAWATTCTLLLRHLLSPPVEAASSLAATPTASKPTHPHGDETSPSTRRTATATVNNQHIRYIVR